MRIDRYQRCNNTEGEPRNGAINSQFSSRIIHLLHTLTLTQAHTHIHTYYLVVHFLFVFPGSFAITESAAGPLPTNVATLKKTGMRKPSPTCQLQFYYFYSMADPAYLKVCHMPYPHPSNKIASEKNGLSRSPEF